LGFAVGNLTGLRYEYRVNGGPRVMVDPIGPAPVTLPLGNNAIVYYISDCAGNTDSCSYQVLVEDQEPPQLTCPSDIAVVLAPGECSTVLDLPMPTGFTDNCALPAPFMQ
ncbi:hypothetical protein RZS08_03410, partial [Arthrospira platensis SPKY1]|nr:hypothetical protein [Arthrospira platensis SPKY1]